MRSLPTWAWLYLLALVLRLVPVLVSIDLPIGLTDMFQYDMLARSIVSGNGFRWYAQEDVDLIKDEYVGEFPIDFSIDGYDPRGIETSFRGPGYPAFLALIYSVSAPEWRFFAARLAQAAIGAALAPLTYLLARRLFPKREDVARFAGIAIATYPMLVIFPLALATEQLFIPLTLAGLLALLHAAQTSRRWHYVLAGFILGYATLTRSVIFIFVGFAVLWILFAARQPRGAAYFTVAALLMVLPWTVRNSLLHNQFTFVENSLGYNLHMGFHPEGTGTFQYGISLELVPYLDDGVRNDLGMEAGLRFIRENPEHAAQVTLNKLGYFFGLERRALTYFYSNGFFGYIPSIPLLGLALLFVLPFPIMTTLAATTIPFVRLNKDRLLLYLLIGGYLLPHLLILAEDRFHLTLLPAFAVLAGYAWCSRRQLWAAARANRVQLLMAALLVGLLWFNWGAELWRDADKLALLFGPEGNHAGFSY
ncbi:MAG: glycosyltransferase family 39 protein [Anaerolineales bacterium]